MADATNENFDPFQTIINESIGPSWVANYKDLENNSGSSYISYPILTDLTSECGMEQMVSDLPFPISNNETSTHAIPDGGQYKTFTSAVSIA